MTRLRIFALFLFCLGLGVFSMPPLSPMIVRAQARNGEEDAKEARLRNVLILERLQQPVQTASLAEKVKLKTALEHLSDKFGGQLPILVDKEAFAAELGPESNDAYEEEVCLPPVPSKMATATALRLIVSQIGKGQATYVIRQGHIEITTLKASSAAHLLREPMLVASFERRPLLEVLEHLSDESGLAIHLDPNVPKKIQPITARFRNSCFEVALVTVTEMAELKFVVMERSVFVTTPAKAVILRKEEAQRARERKQLKPMAKKLEGPA